MGNSTSLIPSLNLNIFRVPFYYFFSRKAYLEEGNTFKAEIVVITPQLHHELLKPNKVELFHIYDPEKFNYISVLNPLTLNRWNVIEKGLKTLRKGSCYPTELAGTIKSYAKDRGGWCNFQVLEDHEVYEAVFLQLPHIIEFALKLKERLAEPVKILRQGENATVFLTRNLACSLLANAFLCTIAKRSDFDLPSFDFFGLFHDSFDNRAASKGEKLKCIVEYFRHMRNCLNEQGERIISFERRSRDQHYYWRSSEAQLCKVSVVSKGRIEENEDMIQVDFANQYVGGGVLSRGAVQEEIRFSIAPELICARLLAERLLHDEVLVVKGTRIFSGYSGYASSFKFRPLREDPWSQEKKVDECGREESYVVCMDALHFNRHSNNMQYHIDNVDRELHKSYVGFLAEENDRKNLPIATGNWGCGAFNGDPELKFLIQWMAASAAGRSEMKYHALDRTGNLAEEMEDIHQKLGRNGISIGQLYYWIEEYGKSGDLNGGQENNPFPTTVFEYIRMVLDVNGVGGSNENEKEI